MGLLSLGTPLAWHDVQQHAGHVRQHGIQQFLKIYEAVKDRHRDCLLWGDEVEYVLVSVNPADRSISLSLRGEDIIDELRNDDKTNGLATWHPEYTRYMIEATPKKPYIYCLKSLLEVEANMATRRAAIKTKLLPNERILTLTNFPSLGRPSSFPKNVKYSNDASRSLFFPDEAINSHARFKTLTANIRERRGHKVDISVPIFRDTNTRLSCTERTMDDVLFPDADRSAAKQGYIYMDAMGFGMGCCCLQITFQACSIDEARLLYDQLTVICPIVLALTAATPIFQGYLSDIDCRWGVISASVDDRTDAERGEPSIPLTYNGRGRLQKSRYDSVSRYISPTIANHPELNDIPAPIDQTAYDTLCSSGIDELLAHHIAHLFVRDPLVVYSELLDQDDHTSTDHFENLQSTNWQTMRFKPPPPASSIGWRVEFRPMEVQLSDFENAAFAIFAVLLTRTVLSFGLTFYIPLSLVDVNMGRAQKRDAVLDQKFHFRSSVYSGKSNDPGAGVSVGEFTIDEIINGRPEDNYPGLVPLVEAYINTLDLDMETHRRLCSYLRLVRQRATGEVPTGARWIRDFVMNHKAYQHDSMVPDEVIFDLVAAIDSPCASEILDKLN